MRYRTLSLPSTSRGAMLRLASEDRRRQMDGSRGNENRNGPLSTVRVHARMACVYHVCERVRSRVCVLRFISPKEMTVEPYSRQRGMRDGNETFLTKWYSTFELVVAQRMWLNVCTSESEGGGERRRDVMPSWKNIKLHKKKRREEHLAGNVATTTSEGTLYLLRHILLHTKIYKFICRILLYI